MDNDNDFLAVICLEWKRINIFTRTKLTFVYYMLLGTLNWLLEDFVNNIFLPIYNRIF